MKNIFRKAAVAVAAVVATSTLTLSPVMAHEADCPYCKQAITQDTPTQDNEVVLRYGRKRIEYKCVYCAIAESKTEYKGDVTIAAPSEKKGAPVVIKRVNGTWSAAPGTAYFVVDTPIKHRNCQVQARAFTTKAAADNYIKAKKLDTAPLTLAQMVAAVK